MNKALLSVNNIVLDRQHNDKAPAPVKHYLLKNA